jgi:hypothetical protein
MRRWLSRIIVLGAWAAAADGAMAQSVELRIVERQGQGILYWPPSTTPGFDNVLCFAVQARGGGRDGTGAGAPAGVGLCSLGFDIVVGCERDAWGTLTRLQTSAGDGTFVLNPDQTTNNAIGLGGLSWPLTGLASVDASANGLINVSDATHVNNVAAQEVRSVRALAAGSALLKVVDRDNDGVPDSSPLNDAGVVVPEGSVAALDRAIAETYFGADGNWSDVFRFKYTRMPPAPYVPTLDFQLIPVGQPTLFSTMRRVGNEWRPDALPATGVSARGLTIKVVGPIRCRADHDQSGWVMIDDLMLFIEDWFAGCAGGSVSQCNGRSADLNCDGVLTVQDLLDFINLWFAGC